MAHFPAWTRFRLAVEVKARARLAEDLLPGEYLFADQIPHFDARAMARRRAERPAGDGPDMLLELRGQRPVESPMAGIMDPRRDLVDAELRLALAGPAGRIDDEYFDGDYADIIERVGDRPCESDRFGGGFGARRAGARVNFRI